MRVIVAGGGYAGLATLIALRHSLPEVELHLIEPREWHIKLTHLHRTLRYPLSDFCTPFAALAKKYDFTHHRFALPIDADNLKAWEWNRTISLPKSELAFDYLLKADRYGRVIVGNYPLPHIFTAGDCSNFDAGGLNSLTAQAAVRKGKQVAANIKRLQQGRLPYIYSYDELGYFVSLGPLDAAILILATPTTTYGISSKFNDN